MLPKRAFQGWAILVASAIPERYQYSPSAAARARNRNQMAYNFSFFQVFQLFLSSNCFKQAFLKIYNIFITVDNAF
jgi:hypothetical protein